MQALDSIGDKILHLDSYVVYMFVLAQIFKICFCSHSHNCQLLVQRLYQLYSSQTTLVQASFRYKCGIADKIP